MTQAPVPSSSVSEAEMTSPRLATPWAPLLAPPLALALAPPHYSEPTYPLDPNP